MDVRVTTKRTKPSLQEDILIYVEQAQQMNCVGSWHVKSRSQAPSKRQRRLAQSLTRKRTYPPVKRWRDITAKIDVYIYNDKCVVNQFGFPNVRPIPTMTNELQTEYMGPI